ncbi:TetR/AcrR family transcriptional regulator [Hydrocarboniphaga effusa]|uniref:TetR/AcrR family transcriptional regulator n=1 Tax=Hydrocarboniphaga effusa TaxID=243629 RepID=UPI00398BD6F6
MSTRKFQPSAPTAPTATTQDRVLEAAERLLRTGKPEFSMRDLAAEAGVSFATPFNQFGSKAAIMQALSARRIDEMHDRLTAANLPDNAVTRVLATVDIAVDVMLREPVVNRSVMAVLGSQTGEPGIVARRSAALWTEALGPGEGLAKATRTQACAALPSLLAIAFRGALSFWTAGEIRDDALGHQARSAATAVLLGFCGVEVRKALLDCVGGGG